MKNIRQNELADRRSAAADAKASLLTTYRAAKMVAEPLKAQRQAERISLVEAREARRAERDRLKLEERELQEAKAAEEKAAAEHSRIARVVEDEAARKAARDKRYADRKARQA